MTPNPKATHLEVVLVLAEALEGVQRQRLGEVVPQAVGVCVMVGVCA